MTPAVSPLVSRPLRSAGLRVIDALGLPDAVLALRRHSASIVVYHGATTERGEGICNYRGKFVQTAAFARQIAWLKERCTIVPLHELLLRVEEDSIDDRLLAITFDDGYRNNYTDAYPILRGARVPATFFITTGFIDGNPLPVDIIEYALGMTRKPALEVLLSGVARVFPLRRKAERIAADEILRAEIKALPRDEARELCARMAKDTEADLYPVLHASPYRPMAWGEMREMERHGMTFGPHTVSHAILSRMSADEARKEIMRSRDTLAARGLHPLPIFAYPNGGARDYTDTVKMTLKEGGFQFAVTTRPGMARRGEPFDIRRYTLDGANEPYRFRMAVTGIQQRLSRLFS